MIETRFDHLVVVAGTREAGIAWVRERLGVPLEMGGEHPAMGTHNALLRLEDTAYLEVLAVNPHLQAPNRTRWFGLDDLQPGDPPRLAGWVARTNDLEGAVLEPRIGWGAVLPMSRGSLRWLLAVRPDGRLPEDGVAPVPLQWETKDHPAARLPDRGCSLVALQGFHPRAEAIREALDGIGFHGSFTVSERQHPGLIGHIQTPAGVRCIESSSSIP
jgi:hypothetical protein